MIPHASNCAIGESERVCVCVRANVLNVITIPVDTAKILVIDLKVRTDAIL